MSRAGRVASHEVFPGREVLVAEFFHPPRLPRRFPDFQCQVGSKVKVFTGHSTIRSALSRKFAVSY